MKRQVLIVPILSCVLFTACFPASKSAHPQNNMSSLNVEEMNQSPYDNLTYQFSIPENYTQNIPEVQCKLKLFEGKDMESLFFGNTKQVYQKEETSESMYIPGKDYYHLYQTQDNTTLCYDAGSILYATEKSDDYYGYFAYYYDLSCSEENMRVLMPEKELDTFSSTDALAYMQNLIETLDLPVASTPEIYALNQNCVENAKTNVGVDIPWDDEADAYMLVYLTEIDSVAAANYTISSSVSDMTEGRPSKLVSVFSKNGLEYLECSYAMEQTEEGDSSQICSPEQAIERVKSHMESMAVNQDESKGTETLSGCSLKWNVLEQKEDVLQLQPVWVFILDSVLPNNDGTSTHYYSTICVDALTGELY